MVISIWTGTPIDGHGHHRACGAATREAFELAGDAAAFPEQIRAGLSPWQPKRLLVRVRDAERTKIVDDLHINVGRFDPLLGRSCFEVAMQGRSLHRSQNMGALQLKGAQNVVYRVGAGVPAAGGQDADPLDGLPVRLEAWAQAFLWRTSGRRPRRLRIRRATSRMRPGRSFTRSGPSRRLAHACRGTWRAPEKPVHDTRMAMHRPCTTACGNVSGVSKPLGCKPTALALEVLAAQPDVAAGGSVDVEAELFVCGNQRRQPVIPATAHAQPGWQVERLEGPALPMKVCGGGSVTARFRLTAPQDEATAVAATLPPWLRLPPDGDLYRFDETLPCLAAAALPPLTVQAGLSVDDLAIPLSAPIAWRELDPARGELRHALRVRPTVNVTVSPSLIVMPASRAAAPTVDVQLHAHAARRGRLVLRAFDGDRPETHVCAALSLQAGEQRTVQQVLPVDSGASGKRMFGVEWHDEAALTVGAKAVLRLRAWQDVRYPHVEPAYWLAPAEVCVSIVAVEVAPGLRVGYLPGTGDGVAEALGALGVSVRTIDEDDLQNGSLAGFDTIVVGVRALETRPSLAAHRGRLWDYARAGGTVVMQYHKPREDGPSRFVPFDGVSLPRPAPRVSQAAAPVSLLAAGDPLLSFPNRLTAEDFNGWQQERGLYFLAEWPPQMTPLLESADPGEEPRRGGLLRARLGRGHYVYCAYALFRQLPAGVPGAYRLLANLVSLPRAPGA